MHAAPVRLPPRGTVVFGFEQANRYQVLDEQGNVVALIAEDQTGIGREGTGRC